MPVSAGHFKWRNIIAPGIGTECFNKKHQQRNDTTYNVCCMYPHNNIQKRK